MTTRRPARVPDFRPSRACLYGSWLFPVLLVLLSMTTAATATECCPGGTTSPEYRNCSDGTVMRLKCPDNTFMIKASSDLFGEFEVVAKANGSYLEFPHEIDPVPLGRFCTSNKNETEKWAMICFEPEEVPSEWQSMVRNILSIISVLFLVLTLVVYIVLPELRDIQDKSMASTVAFLALGYLSLGMLQIPIADGYIEDTICLILAFLMYWSFLSAFFWMNLVAFNVWKTVWCKSFPIRDADLFSIFCAIAVVGPGLFLLAALVTQHTEGSHLKPHFGEVSCWFRENTEQWAFFYGPIAFLLTLNVIYLGLTCWRLWYEYRSYIGSGLRVLRLNCLLYVKLVFVMGFTWIFEVISYASSPGGDSLYWFATDVLNSCQGIIMFILLVPMRRKVKKLLAKRKPFGIRFPKSWAAYDEEDDVKTTVPIEVELFSTHSTLAK